MSQFNSNVQINEKRISFIERLFPELKNYLFIHKNVPGVEYSKQQETKQDFDLTGSPLKCSFQDQQFEDTLYLIMRNWSNEEEQYLPFNRSEACNILNDYLDKTLNELPIFISCDAQDVEKTLLLGSFVKENWFTTMKAQMDGMKTVTQAKNNCSQLIQRHIKSSNIQTSTFLVYNIYGNTKQLIDYKHLIKDNYESSINVHIETPGLTFNPPLRTSSNKLIVQVNGGNEPLNDLWDQLIMLEKYLNIMETYKNTPHLSTKLEFPSDFTSLFFKNEKTVREHFNLLLNGDLSYKNPDQSKIKEIYLAEQHDTKTHCQLEKYIEYLDVRHNSSFTDLLWELLINLENYTIVKEIMGLVLSTVSKNRINESLFHRLHVHNNTKFSNFLNQPDLNLSDPLPLELLIDIGFEKLNRDYMYLVINSRLISSIDIRDSLKTITSTKRFNVQDYRSNLLKLARVHICLEFISLVQTHCDCTSSSNNNLQFLFDCAYKQLTSNESPLESTSMLLGKHVYNLITPCPISILDKIHDKDPSICRLTISSNNQFSKLKTITYYNEMPIFPIDSHDDSEETEKIYHSTRVVCSSNRIK